MEKDEIKNYIDDQVRLSTDSSIKALTNLLNEVIKMFDSHKKEIAIVVENKIETKVNGKIDRLTALVNSLTTAVAELKPVKEKYEDEIKTSEVHDKDRKYVLKWAGIVSAIGIILAGIKYFILNLLK